MSLKDLNFQGTWRDYQARVLAEMDRHLQDGRLHVVAAPGSGKTVLGLEALRRLNAPAIVLAPSITIRNQWIDRLVGMFTDGSIDIDHWVGTSIYAPKPLTIVTYQALHSAFCDTKEGHKEQSGPARPNATTVIEQLNRLSTGVIVLDEAHHLRKEWWKSLDRLKTALGEPKIIALTATPPYDVEESEWRRYEDLCGPPDAEISIPELVRNGDLCPHQDHVYLSLPTKPEAEIISQFRTDVDAFIKNLTHDEQFTEALLSHPWIRDPAAQEQELLGEPEFFSAIIIYLNHLGFPLLNACLRILGARSAEIPPLTTHWLEVLLNGVLFRHVEQFTGHDKMLVQLHRWLKDIGAIDRRRVVLGDTIKTSRLLAGSLSKLDSIETIARAEAINLMHRLRMVVLADYIRAEAFPGPLETGISQPDKIGVVPIFEKLRTAVIPGGQLAILTGSLVVIPATCRPNLTQLVAERGIAVDDLHVRPLRHDADYLKIRISGPNRHAMVHLMTALFRTGQINILIGTQSLLGEGWDAPSINSLILASHVGSFMLSNQMRGRAIRKDPDDPDKAANIWHLASVDPSRNRRSLWRDPFGPLSDRDQRPIAPLDQSDTGPGSDFTLMQRRFSAFPGLSSDDPAIIASGHHRLGLTVAEWDDAAIRDTNINTLRRAGDRSRMKGRWQQALVGKVHRPALRRKIVSGYAPKGLYLRKMAGSVAIECLVLGLTAVLTSIVAVSGSGPHLYFLSPVLLALAIALPFTTRNAIRAIRHRARYGQMESGLRDVADVVIQGLIHAGRVTTDRDAIGITTTATDNNQVIHCSIDGATPDERRQILTAIGEVLNPIDNPRYIIARDGRLAQMTGVEYHAVPSAIGAGKANALHFHHLWQIRIGPGDLIYTRTRDGRRRLLKARTRSFAADYRKPVENTSVWE